MKFHLITIIVLFGIVSCFSQPINFEFQPEGRGPILLGKVNKQGLSEKSYADWFLKNYNDYSPETSVIEKLKDKLSAYTITAFMGTWCGDSKREIPHFYKILDAADFDLSRLTMIAVDGSHKAYKKSPGGEEEGMNIHRVPTFIFYKDGLEVNRITEKPLASLEEDMLAILDNNYTPNYNGVTILHRTLQGMSPERFSKKGKKLIPQLKVSLKSMYELNTYASVLYYSGETDMAFAVMRLNIQLFPEISEVYVRYANRLAEIGNNTEAIFNYQKALEIQPENPEILAALERLNNDNSN